MASHLQETPEIAGLLYKKRGGFGKMMPNNWQYRFFAITKDGILLYFDTEIPGLDQLEQKPRGRLDLKSSVFEISTESIEGAPTAFCISIQVPNEEKWKLCADMKETQIRWCKVFDSFLAMAGKSSRSIASYTSDDEDRPKINNNANLVSKRNSAVFSTSQSTRVEENPQITTDNKPDNSNTIPEKPKKIVPNTSVINTENVDTKSKQVKKKGIKIDRSGTSTEAQEKNEVMLVLGIVNVCLIGMYLAPRNSFLLALIYIVVSNIVVFQTLKLRSKRASKTAIAATSVASSPEMTKQASTTSAVVETGKEVDRVDEATIVATSPSKKQAEPISPTSVSVTSGKPIAGSTFTQSLADYRNAPLHTWSKIDAKLFNVRVGPDYNRYKKKAPSPSALYEPFAVDIFCAKNRVDHAGTRFQLPDTSDIDTHNSFVPPIFIVQLQIPSEPPTSYFSSAEDGPGWALVMYYKITEETCRQLADLSTASPAVKLWAEWCEKAPTDQSMRARFKVINSCTNMEELGFSSLIVSYNAKPVLIRRTGTLFKGSNYMEFDVHVHKFANVAKQGIYQISSLCGQMYMQVGFVIEGREDKELPEALFACVAVNRPQEEQAEFIFDD